MFGEKVNYGVTGEPVTSPVGIGPVDSESMSIFCWIISHMTISNTSPSINVQMEKLGTVLCFTILSAINGLVIYLKVYFFLLFDFQALL